MPEVKVRIANVTELDALTFFVGNLLSDCKRLIVALDGALILTKARLSVAEVSQALAQAITITRLAVHLKRLIVALDGDIVLP